jgi:hypothetical protein
VVNPIKDSLGTKTRAGTTRIAAAIYCPFPVVAPEQIATFARELAGWLCDGKDGARAVHDVLLPGETIALSLE